MILFKVRFDAKIIDSAFQKIITNQATKLKTHFICDSYYYYWSHEDKLRSLILEGMKKYGIQSVMLTIMFMARDKLITNEKMKSYCKGNVATRQKDSVNDDLESFLKDLRLGKNPNERVFTYFLPKLTEEEMNLIEVKDKSYLQNFSFKDPVKETRNLFKDPLKETQNLSESDSKFVSGWCERKTFTMETNFHCEFVPIPLGNSTDISSEKEPKLKKSEIEKIQNEMETMEFRHQLAIFDIQSQLEEALEANEEQKLVIEHLKKENQDMRRLYNRSSGNFRNNNVIHVKARQPGHMREDSSNKISNCCSLQ